MQYIERYHWLRDLGVGGIDLSMVNPPMVRYLADLANWFTEGFDTANLQQAKALLEELG